MSIEQTCTTNAKQRMHAKNYDEYFETPNKSNGRREKNLDKYIPNTSSLAEKRNMYDFFSLLFVSSLSLVQWMCIVLSILNEAMHLNWMCLRARFTLHFKLQLMANSVSGIVHTLPHKFIYFCYFPISCSIEKDREKDRLAERRKKAGNMHKLCEPVL